MKEEGAHVPGRRSHVDERLFNRRQFRLVQAFLFCQTTDDLRVRRDDLRLDERGGRAKGGRCRVQGGRGG